ncbi:hypothetical protein NBRC10513v2_004376 [Rhodotorula toruloides]
MQEPPQLDAVAPNRSKPNYVTPDRPAFWDDFPPLRNFKDPSELHPSELRARLRHPVCLYWFRITSQAAHALLTNAYPRSADEAAIPDEGIMFLWRKEYGLPFIDDGRRIRRFVADRTDDLNEGGVASDLVTALERTCVDEWMVFAPECLKTVDHIALPRWAIRCETRWSCERRDNQKSQRSALAATAAVPHNASTPTATAANGLAMAPSGLATSGIAFSIHFQATLEQAQRVPLDRLFQLTGCKGYLVLSADAEEQTFFLEADEPRKLPLAKDVIDAHLLQIRAGEADAVKAEETVAACGNSGNKVRVVRLFDMDDLPGGLSGFKPL